MQRHPGLRRSHSLHIVNCLVESPDRRKHLVGCGGNLAPGIGQVQLFADDFMQGQADSLGQLADVRPQVNQLAAVGVEEGQREEGLDVFRVWRD